MKSHKHYGISCISQKIPLLKSVIVSFLRELWGRETGPDIATPLSSERDDHSRRGVEFESLLAPGTTGIVSPDVGSSARQTAQNIVNHLHSQPYQDKIRDRRPLTNEFEEFSDEDQPLFVVDREGDSTEEVLICPRTLEEMQFIVRQKRINRLDVIQQEHSLSNNRVCRSGAYPRNSDISILDRGEEHARIPG